MNVVQLEKLLKKEFEIRGVKRKFSPNSPDTVTGPNAPLRLLEVHTEASSTASTTNFLLGLEASVTIETPSGETECVQTPVGRFSR